MNMATISHTDFESILSDHQNIQFCLNLSFFSYHLLLDYLHIKDFNNKNINKNDLRIKLEKDSEEITKIGLVFNDISPSNSVAIDFNNNVDNFLRKIGVEFSGKTIGSHVYKIRNVLVHNMRLAVDYENELNDVVECFEKLIAIRLNKGMSDNHNKHMVVCDTSERYKKNKKRMKKTYVQYKYGK